MALLSTCLLKHSETQSRWGALPLFFLAQRGNKGSRSNQIRHSAIHQSIAFSFLRSVASKHMRTEQPAISHCHCVAYQTSALVRCNCTLRNLSRGFDKPQRYSQCLLLWGWPACAKRPTAANIIILHKSVWNISLFIWEEQISHTYLDMQP